ncbi:hybrid sensor histidine kinase/response regulator [Caulobacter segnis]|uniref:histidine kinase n=2 Tax=Caulobacter segnis TaxID=88688 RepID=D5VP58_CAUST|nr:ATP-binding protein [Caulobacter segnis]ADG12281.1 PAS/PAC sensor hybrid histidine kinase [Caulobacter segnis ATCC 21756]AVQ03877.1 hybrid sensor histidine kinase/response regulator [Caulobacter segnis]
MASDEHTAQDQASVIAADTSHPTKALHSRAFLDAVVESVPAMLVVKDGKDGRFVLINRTGEELLGVPREMLIGRSDADFFPADQAAAFAEMDRRVLDSDRVWVIDEEPLSTPHNGDRWLQTKKIAIPGEGDEKLLLIVSEDITERKKSAAALEAALQSAQAASIAKTEFLANMSHEIRTPLNGVLGMAQVLAQTELTARQREMMDVILNSGRVLNALLSDILDLAKVEAGEVEVETAPFSLRTSIGASAATFEGLAHQKGLTFSLDFGPGFQDRVVGDALKLSQIVNNLISNAVKFTNEGGVAVRAETRRAQDGAVELTVEVEDSGEGFSPEVQASLFERFVQGDGSITRRFGGSGLGLSIALRFAKLMDGDITCQSTPGEGATFRFTARLAPAQAEAPAPVRRAAPTPPIERLRVLFAEDHPTNQRVVELMLGETADLVVVENGEVALQAFESQTFDIVLMDTQMPVMDGLTAIRAIRAREQAQDGGRIPIISLTANAMPHQVEACLQAGADLHLAKPITVAALFESIAAAAELAAQTGEMGRAAGALSASER